MPTVTTGLRSWKTGLIEAIMERGQVLVGLMAKEYLESVPFNREKSVLAAELSICRGKRMSL